jgi:Protein of unknown function (DUF3108)
MWRVPLNSLVLILALAPAVDARDAPSATRARFDVQVLGLKVGNLSMTGAIDAAAYSVAARFATSGLARLYRDARFDMQADGSHEGLAFAPREYAEQVNTGKRRSSARVRYVRAIPVLVEGEVSDGEVAPLDPASQGGTVDPLTIMFMILRDQPADGLCRIAQPVFDGGRRTRVDLTARREEDGTVVCSGEFRRVAGYPQEELVSRGQVPLRVIYRRGANGLMQAQSMELRSSYGRIALTRQ